MNIPKTAVRNFITYFIVFSIPVISLVFFTHTQLIKKFQTTTYNLELSYQNNKLNDFEQNINKLIDIASQIKISETELNENIMSRIDLIDQLRYCKALNNTLEEIILYFPDSSLVYAAQSTYTQNTFKALFGPSLSSALSGISEDEWNAKGLIPLFSDGKLCFIAPYPIYSLYPYGYLVFIVQQGRFMPFSQQEYALYYDETCLINKTGRPQYDLDYARSNGTSVTTANPYSYLSSSMSGGDYSLVTVLNDEETFYDFYHARQLFILTSIIVCTLSMILLSYFSYQSYKPYRDLKHALQRTGLIHERSTNAKPEIYQAIQTMDLLTKHNRLLDEQLIQEQYVSRSLLLNRLLNNQYDNIETINKSLENYRVILNSTYFTVCIFRLNKKPSPQFFLDNMLYYAAHPGFSVYCTLESDLRIYAVIGSISNQNTQLDSLFRKMLQILNGEGISAELYVGSPVMEKDQIHISYIEALSKYNYDDLPDNKIHYYHSPASINPVLFYPQMELNSLRSAVASENKDSAIEILECISSQLLSDTLSYSMAKTVCYEVFHIVCQGLSTEQPESFQTINRYLSKLSKIKTCEDAAAFLTLMKKSLSDTVSVCKSSEECSNLKMERIQSYIMEHFTEPDFYLGAVAEHFSLSRNNLSQQFKRHLGISPAKYITVLKIDQAKELLTKTNMTIKDIAAHIGYSDSSIFVKNFKTITSLTPNQYRNSMRQ